MTATRKGVAKRPTGRPSKFTQATADRICRSLSKGQSLTEICRADGMPDVCSVFRWLRQQTPAGVRFCHDYARAREEQAHVFMSEAVEIADDGRNDWVERQGKNGTFIALNDEAVQRSRLRVDTRFKAAAKIAPKIYGDKITTEVSGPDGGPVEVKVEAEVQVRLAEGLALLRSKLPK